MEKPKKPDETDKTDDETAGGLGDEKTPIVPFDMPKGELTKNVPITSSSQKTSVGEIIKPNEIVKDLGAALSEIYELPYMNLDEITIPKEIIKLLPENLVLKYKIVPVEKKGAIIVVATADPANLEISDNISFATGLKVEIIAASADAIKRAIDRYYRYATVNVKTLLKSAGSKNVNIKVERDETIDEETLRQQTEEAPIVKIVNYLLWEAVGCGASDIHFEPYEKELRVRCRIDGILYEKHNLPVLESNAVINRIKIISKLDVAERRLPQDGHFKAVIENKEIDFRVSIMPTLFGESAVLRLLDKSSLVFNLSSLGFEKQDLTIFRSSLVKPWGMILVTGPTGSGKTTTLYSALTELNQTTKKILTVEDPIEIQLPGITQVQVKEEIGLTFANTLRSFLRQDPDIMMVGEIRDFETAEVAIKAAMTGHLVLSTLHTNDAASAIYRLFDMGIEPFLLTSSLNLICAQRLIRKICEKCKTKINVPVTVLFQIGFSEEEIDEIQIKTGKGCNFCDGTGYKGRIACYELMPVTEKIKEAILQGHSSLELKLLAINSGMSSLYQSGLKKIKQGITTIEEVLRVTRL